MLEKYVNQDYPAYHLKVVLLYRLHALIDN